VTTSEEPFYNGRVDDCTYAYDEHGRETEADCLCVDGTCCPHWVTILHTFTWDCP
jgi:hypothetical protein